MDTAFCSFCSFYFFFYFFHLFSFIFYLLFLFALPSVGTKTENVDKTEIALLSDRPFLGC